MDLRVDDQARPHAQAPSWTGDDALSRRSVASAKSAWWQRTPVVAVVLLVLYVVVGLFTDPDGYLSTDVGGKTASLAAMEARGDWDPDIGYWLEAEDPDGDLHAAAFTRRTQNGQWVNSTSFPMIYLARPFWMLGGSRAALLVPMMGAVAAAAAAGALERRWKPGSTGVLSMWLVGAAGPVVIYALDFWEHSLGTAGMLWGMVAATDAVENRRPTRSALLAGLAFGFAASMRQEALVYGFVTGLALVGALAMRRQWFAAALRGGVMAVTSVGVLVANTLAEVAITGGAYRAGRSTETASAAGAGVIERIRAAFTTLVFPFNGDHPISYIFGVGIAVGLAWLTFAWLTGRRRESATMFAILFASVTGAMLLMLGPRFVPGLVPTTPLAVVGLTAGIVGRRWWPLALGVLPVPLLMVVQFAENHAAQWAGRYLLPTGAVLVVLAVVALADEHRRLLAVVAAGGLAVTAFGVVWTAQRSHQVTDDWETLASIVPAEEPVVWRDYFKPREAGPVLLDKPWLSAPWAPEQERAAEVLAARGVETFVWLDDPKRDLPDFDDYEAGETLGTLEFFELRIVRFESVG